MSQWYAVIEAATGRAISFGDALDDDEASLAARGLALIAIDNQPEAGERWDEAQRAIVTVTPEDRAARLAAQADALLAAAKQEDPSIVLDRSTSVAAVEVATIKEG